jgi:hypothetical protein
MGEDYGHLPLFWTKNSVDGKESLMVVGAWFPLLVRSPFGQFRTYVRNLSGEALFANMKQHLELSIQGASEPRPLNGASLSVVRLSLQSGVRNVLAVTSVYPEATCRRTHRIGER